MLKRALTAIAIFLAVGEAMFRFDASTLYFQGGEHLSNSAKRSPELDALNAGTFRPVDGQLRVLVVGDSWLYGAGVAPEKQFSSQLRTRLSEVCTPPCPGVAVLDLTAPGNNTYANVRDFRKYVDQFRPQIAILAYNENDVYGRQEEQVRKVATTKAAESTDGAGLDNIRSLRRLLFSSKLMEFALTKANMELKLAGVVVPGTEFEHQVNKSHAPDYPGWVRSQRLLAELSHYCRSNGIHLLVANMPELNMLGNHGLYAKADAAVEHFFRSLEVDYVNTVQAFLSKPGEEFAISRYDGHPNEKAHTVAAEFVATHLTRSAAPRLTTAYQQVRMGGALTNP